MAILKDISKELSEGLDLRALAKAALVSRKENLLERANAELDEQIEKILNRIFGPEEPSPRDLLG